MKLLPTLLFVSDNAFDINDEGSVGFGVGPQTWGQFARPGPYGRPPGPARGPPPVVGAMMTQFEQLKRQLADQQNALLALQKSLNDENNTNYIFWKPEITGVETEEQTGMDDQSWWESHKKILEERMKNRWAAPWGPKAPAEKPETSNYLPLEGPAEVATEKAKSSEYLPLEGPSEFTEEKKFEWKEKMSKKWEFMADMKEKFKNVDWSAVKDNMPWEMITKVLEKMSDPNFEMPDWKAKKTRNATRYVRNNAHITDKSSSVNTFRHKQ